MWQPAKRYEPNLNPSTCEIDNYDSLDLAARYTAVCKQAACITQRFTIAVSDLTPRYDETSCEAMAKKRIEDEMTYIQTLMVRKSNTLMKDMWQSYTQSYLLETRRTTLIDKFSKVNETFSLVNGKVQE
ncbi:hypothetical protein KBC03_03440 [Patescibacteria group bacterium]|nr:hypothetical protein [Patescibacteria group bacterium]